MLTTKLGISELDGMENWEKLCTYGNIAGKKSGNNSRRIGKIAGVENP